MWRGRGPPPEPWVYGWHQMLAVLGSFGGEGTFLILIVGMMGLRIWMRSRRGGGRGPFGGGGRGPYGGSGRGGTGSSDPSDL
jgi:hypothetical protein